MQTIYFATTNKNKLLIALTLAAQAGLRIKQVVLDIDEIQGEDAELIIKDKARRAYELFGKPLVVSDDSWSIPALKGFPGPYMKSINKWFGPEDFLRLMVGLEDRAIILHQYLAYHDGQKITVFRNELKGQITHEARGRNDRSSNTSIVVLDADNGKTIAETFEQGETAITERHSRSGSDAWQVFFKYYKNLMEAS